MTEPPVGNQNEDKSRAPAVSGDFVIAFEDGAPVEKRMSRELALADVHRQKDGPDLSDTVLDGKYRVIRRLGGGGMGCVYLAEHQVLQKKVAIKVLLPEWSTKPVIVERFLREARAASRISHQHVIQVVDHGVTSEGLSFMVMEYLEGQELRHMMYKEGPLPWSRVRPILLQIADALSAAHAKYVYHRDLKPANVFLVRHPTGNDYVKIIDFGIAKIADENETRHLTRTGTILGTADYLSPEQARGRPITHQSDQYSLGIIAYEMLTGKVPFHDETFMGTLEKHVFAPLVPPRELKPDIPVNVEQLVIRMLEKEPESRYDGMEEVLQVLQLLDDGGHCKVPEPESGSGKKELAFWATVILLLAAGAAAAWYLW